MPNGEIAVADSGNKRIQRFSSSGAYVRKINQPASSLAASSDGVLFASDHWGSQAMGGDGSWRKALNQPKSEIVAWGDLDQTVPNDLTDAVAIAANNAMNLAVLRNGTVKSWGYRSPGSAERAYDPPADLNDVVDVAVGGNGSFCMALKADGTLRLWGPTIPDLPRNLTNVVAISAGAFGAAALLNDGKAKVSWYNPYPDSFYKSIAVGDNGAIATSSGDSPFLWADWGSTHIPESNVIDAAWGKDFFIFLKNDGTLLGGGDNNYGQSSIPAGLSGVVAIAVGPQHSLALLGDGTVRAWGANVRQVMFDFSLQGTNGQSNVPGDLRGVSQIAAGHNHSLALKDIDGGYFAGLCALPNGDFFEVRESGRLCFYSRTYRTILPDEPNSIPRPVVLASSQRPGTSLVDVDFRVDDEDDATVHVAALAFRNGGTGVGDVIPMRTLVEGTDAKLGAAVATGQVHRITWDARADMAGDFEQLQYEILAKDQRSLLNLDYLTLPAEGSQPALKISKTPLKDEDFLPIWLWLVATGDSRVTCSNGNIKLSASKYVNGLNAIYTDVPRSWIDQWMDPSQYEQYYGYNPDNYPREYPTFQVDLVPHHFGYKMPGGVYYVDKVEWTGFFYPQKTGSYLFSFGFDDTYSNNTNTSRIQVENADVFDGAMYGNRYQNDRIPRTFTIDAQAGVARRFKINLSSNEAWQVYFSLNIQPPGEPSRAVMEGDFVREKPVISDKTTSQEGRAFLLSIMGLREATPEEVLRAKEAGTPGIINQWTPPLQVGPGDRPLKVNAYGFETGDAGVWVVPVAP